MRNSSSGVYCASLTNLSRQVPGNFQRIHFVRFYPADGFSAVVVDQLCIDHADKDSGFTERIGDRFGIFANVLNDYPCFTIKGKDEISKFSQSLYCVSNIKRCFYHLAERPNHRNGAFAFRHINTDSVHGFLQKTDLQSVSIFILVACSICGIYTNAPIRAELPALIERHNKRIADCFRCGREV